MIFEQCLIGSKKVLPQLNYGETESCSISYWFGLFRNCQNGVQELRKQTPKKGWRWNPMYSRSQTDRSQSTRSDFLASSHEYSTSRMTSPNIPSLLFTVYANNLTSIAFNMPGNFQMGSFIASFFYLAHFIKCHIKLHSTKDFSIKCSPKLLNTFKSFGPTFWSSLKMSFQIQALYHMCQ